MHPDEATEAAVDIALTHNKPFAVVFIPLFFSLFLVFIYFFSRYHVVFFQHFSSAKTNKDNQL
jgi:hypothetical protein